MKKVSILILFFTSLLGLKLMSQNSNTLYVMENVFQNQLNNPSFEPVSNVSINLFSASAEAGFSGFPLGRLVNFGGDESSTFDPNEILERLNKNNEFSVKLDATVFGFGFKVKSSAFQVSLRARSTFSFNLPQDVVRLALEGNGETFVDRPADLSNLSVNGTTFAEFGIGTSFPVGNRLRLGGTVKFLSGIANIRTEQSDLTLTTNQENYGIRVQGAYRYRTSNVNIVDPSAAFEGMLDSLSQFKFQNTGIGLDLGFSFKFSERLKITGALLDLGAIAWNNNARVAENKGFDFRYEGEDVFEFIRSDTSSLSTQETLRDSLESALQATERDENYTALLPTRLIASVEYKLSNSNFIGGVISSDFVPGINKIRPSVMAYYRLQLGKTFGLGLSNAFAFNSVINPGVALTAKLSILQFFISSDNVLGLINPKATRSASGAFGVNLVFGGNRGIKDVDVP